jgi:NADPH:quinone reductase-like Zn-dependent oxidoreductase
MKMKAAVLYQLGQPPRYADFDEPVPVNEEQLLVTIKAAAIKNLDKGRASGVHYASYKQLPVVVGVDGVGALQNGTRIYAFGLTGMIAEKALISSKSYVKLPDGISDVTAAALPNGVIGAGAALRLRAKLAKGETVLINGATGVTGMLAIQIAKHYGAKKVIAMGRNEHVLQTLHALGADEVISLKQEEEQILHRLAAIHSSTPIDVVIDYTWGHPAELILQSLKGNSVSAFTHRVRYVTVGGMAGDKISLSSNILRSSAIEILGSGLGSLSEGDIAKIYSDLLPEMLQLAADGKLKIETVTAPLKDVESAWNMDAGSKRVVIVI